MQKGQAIPFIMIDESLQGQEVECTFKIHPKAHEIFTSDAVRNKKIAIATVAGPQRTGKSFLSNRLLKRMKGFAIGPSTMPCTKGLWIWGEPIKVSEDTVLIIMDTQGLNSVQRDINVDLKIFSLSILLSSVFIYNSIGHIDEKALENMSYVLRISENIRINSDETEKESDMAKFFPYFYWVLRDFSLNLDGKSESEYLEESLKPVSSDESDPRNQIRAKIRKLFTQRRCDCFPRPVNEENKLAHIEDLNFEDLRDSFKNKMKNFERYFYSSLPPKTINNKPITGSIYFNLVHEYVNAMNSGKVPKIMNSFESVILAEIRKICDNYRNTYRQAMDEFMKPERLPLEETEIEAQYQRLLKMIEAKLDEKFKIWGDIKIVQNARMKFIEDLSGDLKSRVKENAKKAEMEAIKLMKLFEEIQLPELKNSDMITTTLVTQKQQQFTQKQSQFLDKSKSSIKYNIFTKKFPPLIFHYFSTLVARVKGVYTEELNKLRIDSKNGRAEVESVRRIMEEQEELCLMRQKEVEGLIHERDQLRRTIKKNEEMKKFEEDTLKLSKKDIKKELENLKKQLLEREEENEQLNDLVDKLREENANLKQREPREVLVKEESTTESSRSIENLPNQLVYSLMGLKSKLSVMNEFYEKKANDEELDDYLARQIEEIRSDKYAQIEKIREECRSKIEDARKKTDKIKETYEKQLEMINLHLDDIKKENIDLQRRVTDSPGNDSRRNGFIAEKRKYEESLKLKQNHLNSMKSLNEEKDKQIAQLQDELRVICDKMAELSSEKANLESFKENFWYLLRESLNYVLQKQNKLKHAMKPLESDDQKTLKEIFSTVGKPL